MRLASSLPPSQDPHLRASAYYRNPQTPRPLFVLQDPHLRPNFTAVVDMLDEVAGSGCVSTLDIMYWSRPGGGGFQ